ncbi:MAG: hypothetical protein COA42_06860 [Alteromonadaceae bacterium]|nr:MAG: hypothetical protein COA42_06860 [Alteromonadaceae bacterium]
MDRVLNWHPRFIHHCHSQQGGVFLLSEHEALWLSEANYPGINFVDGKKSENDIIAAIDNFARAAMVIYQFGKLVQEGILVDQERSITFDHYCTPSPRTQSNTAYPPQNQPTNNHSILNLSQINEDQKRIWEKLISSLILTPNTSYANTKKVSRDLSGEIIFVLIDDFIDQQIISKLPKEKPYILLKISGYIIWLSPVIRHDAGFQLADLQARLINNQPVRKFIQQHSDYAINTLPFSHDTNLRDDQISTISSLISQQIGTEENHESEERVIIQFNTYQDEASQHNIEAFFSPQGKQDPRITEELKTSTPEIQLKSCPSHFDIDGGSRSVAPEETLKNLQALISPITGIISKLDALDDMEDQKIKIYQSAFCKTLNFHSHSNIDQNDFIQACLGKGVSPVQSQVSALCEAVERHSAQYQGDEPAIHAKQSELTQPSISHQQLTPYSTGQYQSFQAFQKSQTLQKNKESQTTRTHLKRTAINYNDEAIHWYKAWSLSTKAAVYLPLTCCFANTPLEEEKFGRWHSNGAAAGNTLEEAILQALFELIERDAIAIWWYNQVERPEFSRELIDQQRLKLITHDLDQQHDYWLLDITNDIGIPVIAAIARHRQNHGYSMGFGCHLHAELAAQRALTELCQLIPIRDQKGVDFDFDAIIDAPYLHPQSNLDQSSNPPATQHHLKSSGDIKDDIINIIEQLSGLGFETIAFDYSRPRVPIRTAKVFVPGLCHMWPQLANERLYTTPVCLNWLSAPNTESSINPQALYI